MEPRMITKEAFTVIGVTAAGQPGELNYSEIWEKRYMAYDAFLKPHSTDGGYYGVTLGEEGKLVYLAGMAAAVPVDLPQGLEQREIPAASYAVFDCDLDSIGATWQKAYHQWLPNANYKLDNSAVDFEYYPPHSGEGEIRAEIYIPVKINE